MNFADPCGALPVRDWQPQGAGEDWSNWPRRHPMPLDIMLSNKSWGKQGGSEWLLKWRHLSCQENITHNDPSLLGSGWTSARQWKAVNELLVLLWLQAQLLLYFYFSLGKALSLPTSFHTFSFVVSPHPSWGEQRSGLKIALSCLRTNYSALMSA